MKNKENLWIFGGSKGIGGVFTKRMLESGEYAISLFARSNPYNFAVDFVSVDFCKQDSFMQAFKKRLKEVEKIHHLVFFLKYRGGAENAFIGEIAVEIETLKNVMENVSSFLENGASIVLVSSVCGALVANNQGVEYHFAKAALEQMARFYAVKLGNRNIRVNVVAPSLTLKPENALFYKEQTRLRELYSSICPLGRMGKSEDVCEVIEFLMRVGFMTGQVLRVDGGVSLQEYEGLIRSLVQKYLQKDLQIDTGDAMQCLNNLAGGGAYLAINRIASLKKGA